jgi:hypothetical protein
MDSNLSENPYHPPKATHPEPDVRTSAQAVFRVVAWVLWAGLVISLIWNLVDKDLYRVSEFGSSACPNLLVLGLVAAGQTILVLAMRWIFFRLMMRNVDPAGLRGAVRCVGGVVVIYGMIKAMETVGLRLWSGSGWLAHYYCFALPYLVLMVLMMPARLVEYLATGQKARLSGDKK